jgi:hypothetical protein
VVEIPELLPYLLLGILLEHAPRGAALQVDIELLSDREPRLSLGAKVCATPITTTQGETSSSPLTPICASAEVPGSTGLLLDPGMAYLVHLEGEGVWAPPVSLEPATGERIVTLTASRAGTLEAALVDGTGEPLAAWPQAVQARFQLHETPLKLPRDSSFEGSCPVTMDDRDGRFVRCQLPEGLLDLRLEAEGFIPLYLWALGIPPGEPVEARDYRLERGASIVGAVTREDGEPAVGAEMTLGPAVGDSTVRFELGARITTLESRAETQDRGFFQLRGIAPGSYALEARLAEYGVLSVPQIIVSEPAEYRLASPLVIPFFPVATVVVDPPVDHARSPWTVRLFQSSAPLRQTQTDAIGEATFELLPTGELLVLIEDAKGQRWLSRTEAFSPTSPRVQVEIAGIPVVGQIGLDEEPLAASLYFGGKSGAESVVLESGADGEFVGLLPREGVWILEVQSEEPKVRWKTRNLLVEVDPGLGAAELAIELPGTSIEGRVLETDRHPAPGAQVILQPTFIEGGIVQVETGADGTFAMEGQLFGTYQIKAIGRGRRTSGVETVELSKDRPDAALDLILHETREVRGRVVYQDARGVPGATVRALREQGLASATDFLIPSATTGPEGEFLLHVPPDGSWTGVAVLAPGYVLAVEPIPPAPGEDWVIHVAQTGGGNLTLVGLGGPEKVFPTATLDGRWVLPFGVLTTWSQQKILADEADSLVISNLPPGSYRVCVATRESQPTCHSGLLFAGGSLNLILKENER